MKRSGLVLALAVLAAAALPGWTKMRDLPEPPRETFRDWWRRERG